MLMVCSMGQRRFKSFCIQPSFDISFLQSLGSFFFFFGQFSVCRKYKNISDKPYYLLFLTRDSMYLDVRLEDVLVIRGLGRHPLGGACHWATKQLSRGGTEA